MNAELGRDTVRHFVLSHAPTLRVRTGTSPTGAPARRASFSFRGQDYEVEAIEGENGCTDADATVHLHCAWLIRKALGLRTTTDVRQRREIEQKIVAASLSGDVKRVEDLGLELAMQNERRVGRRPVRTRFER